VNKWLTDEESYWLGIEANVPFAQPYVAAEIAWAPGNHGGPGITPVTAGVWYFLGLSFNPVTVVLSVGANDVWQASGVGGSPIVDNARPFRLMEHNEDASKRIHGRLQQVWIAATTLTTAEWTALYTAQAPLFA
jgi:hypothetical protein